MTDRYAELDAAAAPIKAANPGITNGEMAELLPQHLRQQLWERAVGNYLDDELAKLAATPKRPATIATVPTILDGADHA